MNEGSNDPRTNPGLAARNRRTAILLALVALSVYLVFFLGYAL